MGKKLDMVAKVQGYYNKIYLIFFKAYKQEVYLVDALKSNNANAVEQNRNSLAQYAAEGIEKLKELNGLNSDKSVENACRKVLEFYKTEAEKDFEVISEFLLTAENFEKAKKAFESSSKSRDDAEACFSFSPAFCCASRYASMRSYDCSAISSMLTRLA